MRIDRRDFVRGGIGLAFSAPMIGVAIPALLSRTARAAGEIMEKADLRDGQIRLALPEGWTYRSFGATGDIMADGVATPGRQDGMGAFAGPDGRLRVVRNHEERESGAAIGDASKAYDSNTIGGTTTLEVDAKSRELLGDWVSLNGTSFNCAGGVTPWGTWLSVEETVNGPDVRPDFAKNGPEHLMPHGFVFEVDPRWGPGEHAKAVPIRKAGRFPHEACSLDPATGALYLTEDQFLFPAGMYRYRTDENPVTEGRILDGGTLEMMRIKGSSEPVVTGGVLTVGESFDIDWVSIDNPDPEFSKSSPLSNNDAIRTVSLEGFEKGGAKFARPEGCWFSDGSLWFTCTRGGSSDAGLNESPEGEYGDGRGQVWRYEPATEKLTLAFQSTDPEILDLPDNLTVSPSGGVVICEDGQEGNFVRLLKPDGSMENLVENRTDRPDDEFAGVCFSPDGTTMFVNIQASNGLTFAIWREDNAPLV